MNTLLIAFPAIEPEIFRFGPFALRWYALAYVAGIVLGWRLALRLAARAPLRSRAAWRRAHSRRRAACPGAPR